MARQGPSPVNPSSAEAVVARPARLGPQAATVGDSASASAMARLGQALAELKQQAVVPLLNESVAAIRAADWQGGAEWALKALEIDERSGLAWWLLAICRDKAGDYRSSISCYESALKLLPDHAEIANDLGRLAFQLGEHVTAEKLFAHFLVKHPGHPEGANNLACALREQDRHDEAITILQTVLMASPDQPLLWNTLGTILNEQGDMATCVTFYDEALRLDPAFARARYNRANALLGQGDPIAALADVEAALPGAEPGAETAMMRLARSTMLLSAGRIGEGWDAYEARNDDAYADATRYLVGDRPRWTPETDLAGKSILVIGEQGLGDEILFANVLPDLVEALGADGRLTLAVEPRQVTLFQRAFPQARVGAHGTFKVDGRTLRTVSFIEDFSQFDCWTPIASLLRRWRRSVDAYPGRTRFLEGDAERVAYWRAQLAELGPEPKVGVLWKSLKLDSARRRYFSPFEQWRPVLETPGVRFVNLQYGDCAAELAQARAAGLDVWNPPGIDLKQDLDDVAALTVALDLVVGPANATTNIAAACGAPVWLISVPGAWTQLGEANYPWYPQARVFNPPALNQWAPVMAEVAAALREGF